MDNYKIEITQQARSQLEYIREYIAIDLKEPLVAKKLLDLFLIC